MTAAAAVAASTMRGTSRDMPHRASHGMGARCWYVCSQVALQGIPVTAALSSSPTPLQEQLSHILCFSSVVAYPQRNTTNATTSILSNEASTTAGSLDKKDASKAAIAQRRSARLSKNDSQPNAKADAAVAVAAPQEEPSVLATTQSQAVKKKYDTSILEIAKRRRRERTEAAARARSLQQQEAKRSKLSDPDDHGGAEDATEAAAPVPKTRGRSRQENEEEEKASEYQLRRGRSRSKKPPPSSTLAPTAAAVTVASPVAGDVCYEMVPATVLDPNMYTPGIADYDLASRGNVLEVPEYVTDIYQRLYEAEVRVRPNHCWILLSTTVTYIWCGRIELTDSNPDASLHAQTDPNHSNHARDSDQLDCGSAPEI